MSQEELRRRAKAIAEYVAAPYVDKGERMAASMAAHEAALIAMGLKD